MLRRFLAMLSVAFVAQSASAQSPDSIPANVASSHNGPFGLWMGMTVAELRRAGAAPDTANEGFYHMVRAPKPHPAFETYELVAFGKYGLCKIVAIGKNISTGGDGAALRSQFESLESALNQKYGENKKFDMLHAGSIWREPNEFMMGLKEQERTLEAFWDKDGGLDPEKADGVSSVDLEAKALSGSTGYVDLSYEFVNAHECLTALRANRNRVL